MRLNFQCIFCRMSIINVACKKKKPNPQTILSLTTLIKYGIYSLNKFNNYENALFFSKKRVDMLTHFPAPNPLKIDFVHTICKVSRSMSIFVKTPSNV